MQAIILTAYKDFELLNKLVLKLSESFDVFIHIDKKSKFDKSMYSMFEVDNIHIYQKLDIKWGGYNHLEAILFLMEKAIQFNNYTYFHLISGLDWPVKSINEIYLYYEGKKDIFIDGHSISDYEGKEKLRIKSWYQCYWYMDKFNHKNMFVRCISKAFSLVQMGLNIHKEKRFHCDLKMHKALVWCDLPDFAVRYILRYMENNNEFIEFLKYTCIPEEFCFATILMNNSQFIEKINKNTHRYMVWENRNGSFPAVLDEKDIVQIEKEDFFWARKIQQPFSNSILEKYN